MRAPRRFLRSLLLPVLILAGCAPEPTSLAWPEGSFSVAFLIFRDDPNHAVVGPFELEGATAHLESTVFATEDQRPFLFALTDEDLLLAHPFIDVKAALQARVVEPPASCPAGKIAEDSAWVTVPLPPSTSVWRADQDAARFLPADPASLLGDVGLATPLDWEACPPVDQDELAPLGEVLGADREVRVRGVALDAERVVVATASRLILLERGKTEPLDTVEAVEDLRSGGENWSIDFLEVIPGLEPMEGAQLLVGAGLAGPLPTEPDLKAALLEVRLDETLRFGRARTATVWEGNLLALDIAQDGRVLAVGKRGVILTATSAAGPYERLLLPSGDDVRSVLATGDPETPHAIGGTGAVYLGDFSRGIGGLGPRETIDPPGRLVRALASARGPDGLILWASVTDGAVFQRDPRTGWAPVTLDLPPAAQGCGVERDPDCGYRGNAQDIEDIELRARDGSYELLLLPDECAGLLRVRENGCTSVLVPPAVEPRDVRAGFFRDLWSRGDQIYVTGGLSSAEARNFPDQDTFTYELRAR